MDLRTWRTERQQTLGETARALGICGINPGGTLGRIEIGSRQPDADMIERIERLTGRIVTAADMHAVRLAWLKANRPEKFDAAAPAPLPPLRTPGGENGFCREAAE